MSRPPASRSPLPPLVLRAPSRRPPWRHARRLPGLAAVLLLLLLLAAVPAAAQLVPDGPRVEVGAVGPGTTPDGVALDEQRPRLLVAADGSFRVFWWQAGADPAEPRLLARPFAADGTPLGGAREYLDGASGSGPVGGLDDVAANADGDFAVVWVDPREPDQGVLLRIFDAAGDPLGPVVEVGLGPAPLGTEVVGLDHASVALTGDRVAVVAWVQVVQEIGETGPTFEGAVIQRVDATGAFVEPFHRVAADSSILDLQVAAGPGGGYGVAVEAPTVDPAANDVRYVQYDADGVPVPTPPVAPDLPLHPSQENPAVAADGTGSFLLAFEGGGGQGPDGVDGRCTGVFARPAPVFSDEVQVNPVAAGCQGSPRAAGLATGWVVSWNGADADPVFGADGSERGVYLTTFPAGFDAELDPVPAPIRVLPALAAPYDLAAAGDRAAVAAVLPDGAGVPRVVVQRLSPAGAAACVDGAGEEHLCLQGDRFRVDGDWRDPYNGGDGQAFARGLREDTGALWFFREGNLELLVKVLDGAPVNDRWWVFYGALSTVEYWLTVTDLEAGRQNVYHNPPFVQASVADTDAFTVLEDGAGAAAISGAGESLPLAATAAREVVAPGLVAGPLSPATCDVLPTELCLQDAEFRVFVEWHDPRTGNRGSGQKVAITDDTGAFWFFDEDNLELMIKVLDGRPVNGHWWVIYAGLSDVEYTIRVVHLPDEGPQEEKVYVNDPFALRSGADTTAFDGD